MRASWNFPSLAFTVALVSLVMMQPRLVRAQAICGSWTQFAAPEGATGAITNVTARSANDAWALSTNLGTIHWDGVAWSPLALPDLSGLGSSTDLRALVTLPSGQIFAAGVVSTGPFSSDQLLLGWGGSAWDVVEPLTLAANSSGWPRNGAPRAIDGVGAGDLWIVGTSNQIEELGPVVLTVHWDGLQLVEYVTPGLGDRQNHLYDVAALAADDAWAVGEFSNWAGGANGAFHGMTFHWDGSSWNHVPNPTETIDMVDLHAVAAIASNDVWAAGSDPNGPLFMHWDGTSWTIVPSPSTAGTIQKLAAIASDDIWAVDSPWALPTISKYYHWDGSAWSVVTPTEIPGATSVSRHGGLAAVGECDVWAVGSATIDGSFGPFIERLQSGQSTVSLPQTPITAAVLEAYPNPTRLSAAIRLEIPDGSIDRVRVFDVRGRLVRTLLTDSGSRRHRFLWDTRDDHGQFVSGGVYYLRADWGEGRVLTRKLVVMR